MGTRYLPVTVGVAGLMLCCWGAWVAPGGLLSYVGVWLGTALVLWAGLASTREHGNGNREERR